MYMHIFFNIHHEKGFIYIARKINLDSKTDTKGDVVPTIYLLS